MSLRQNIKSIITKGLRVEYDSGYLSIVSGGSVVVSSRVGELEDHHLPVATLGHNSALAPRAVVRVRTLKWICGLDYMQQKKLKTLQLSRKLKSQSVTGEHHR